MSERRDRGRTLPGLAAEVAASVVMGAAWTAATLRWLKRKGTEREPGQDREPVHPLEPARSEASEASEPSESSEPSELAPTEPTGWAPSELASTRPTDAEAPERARAGPTEGGAVTAELPLDGLSGEVVDEPALETPPARPSWVLSAPRRPAPPPDRGSVFGPFLTRQEPVPGDAPWDDELDLEADIDEDAPILTSSDPYGDWTLESAEEQAAALEAEDDPAAPARSGVAGKEPVAPPDAFEHGLLPVPPASLFAVPRRASPAPADDAAPPAPEGPLEHVAAPPSDGADTPSTASPLSSPLVTRTFLPPGATPASADRPDETEPSSSAPEAPPEPDAQPAHADEPSSSEAPVAGSPTEPPGTPTDASVAPRPGTPTMPDETASRMVNLTLTVIVALVVVALGLGFVVMFTGVLR